MPSALNAVVILTFGFSGKGRGVPVTAIGYMPSLKLGPVKKTATIMRTTIKPIAICLKRS